MHNILEQPLVRVTTNEGERENTTLPGLIALLMQDEISSVTALRNHQRHALHSFIVQTAVMAMEIAGETRPPETAGEWRELLRLLTPQHPVDEPWQLLQQDWSEPAFMQPPCGSPEAQRQFQKNAETPGRLDIIVTSKNHEVKQRTVQNAQPDDWLMAIINMQTMEHASGSGRKGCSRIRDGSSSRPAFSIMPLGGGIGSEIRRDITALLQKLPTLRERYPRYPREGGIRLLWTEPWDGTEEEQLRQEELHPLYVDVARRLRMDTHRGEMLASYASSGYTRIPRDPRGGLTGDPWAPVHLEEGTLLKLTGVDERPDRTFGRKRLAPQEAFSYRNIITLLFSQEWEHPLLLDPTEDELQDGRTMKLVARCLARHQGKSFGYHDRQVEITSRFQEALLPGTLQQDAGAIATERMAAIDRLEGMLRTCVRVFLEGGREGKFAGKEPKDQAKISVAAVRAMEHQIDLDFLRTLQQELEASPEERAAMREGWMTRRETGAIDRTRAALDEAMENTPHSSISQQQRARAAAESLMENWLRSSKGFPELFPPREQPREQPDVATSGDQDGEESQS